MRFIKIFFTRRRLRSIAFLCFILLIGIASLIRTHASQITSSVSAGQTSSTASAYRSQSDESPVAADAEEVRLDEERIAIGRSADETNATVVHVVDGDTLDANIDGLGTVRIRMLGVDTPEVVDPRKPVQCFGKEASAFSKKTLSVGSRIRLLPDPEADERDTYGRLLRNVYLADGTDYNAYLVKQGYAHAYTYFPLTPSRKVQMIQLQREAKEAGRGLWAGCE